jgi:hypothetical protein
MSTTGFQEIKFCQEDAEITLIDVGGSLPCRRKWSQVVIMILYFFYSYYPITTISY